MSEYTGTLNIRSRLILFLALPAVALIIVSPVYYLSNIHAGPTVRIFISEKENLKIEATSPTGGPVFFVYDSVKNDYFIQGRFIKDIIFTGNPGKSVIVLDAGKGMQKLNTDGLEQIGKNRYRIKHEVYPDYSWKEKIRDLGKVDWHRQFFFRFARWVIVCVKLGFIILISGILGWLIYLSISRKHKLLDYFKSLRVQSRIFFATQKFRILFPFIFSFIPGTLYYVYDPQITGFLNSSPLGFIFTSALMLFPLCFAAFFAHRFNANKEFWISLTLIFVINAFILFPKVYLYGLGFRDDLSKFYVKACEHNFPDALFTPNSGYLAVLQSFIPYVLFKVLGIKYYLPEALQLTTLLISSVLFASFNLKFFRHFIPDDTCRFMVSVGIGVLKIAFPLSLFMYEIPFIGTVLLWLILWKIHKLNPTGVLLLALLFMIFILSKPVYIIFAPFLIITLLYGLFRKNKKFVFFSLVCLVCLAAQVVVYAGNPVSLHETATGSGLGTNVISDFRVASLSLKDSLFFGIYVYVRTAYNLLMPYLPAGILQMITNVVLFLFLLAINVFLVYRYFRLRRTMDLFVISGSFLAFLSAVLFVRTAAFPEFSAEGKSILNMDFRELLSAGFVLSYHRYLTLCYLPLAVMIIYTFSLCIRNTVKKPCRIILLIFLPVILSSRIYLFTGQNTSSEKNIKSAAVFARKPVVSLWRQYADLMFLHPEAFYIPYYGYPLQSENIRKGIDRITDITIPDNGFVKIKSLPYNTGKWKILQIIAENDSILTKNFYGLVYKTEPDDSLFVKPYFPVDSNYRQIIFRFDKFMEPGEIKFVDKRHQMVRINKPVRLVGTYE